MTQNRVILKSESEIKTMQVAGERGVEVLKYVLNHTKPGITTLELDVLAFEKMKELNVTPSFLGYDGYKYHTCININAGIVHGIPNGYKIKSGDIVSVDLGVSIDGLNTDLSYTVEVETKNEEKFLKTGLNALWESVGQVMVGKSIGDISYTMQKLVEKDGYSVSRDLVGHGVGRDLHEDPFIPCFGKAGRGPDIQNGMTLAVEVIYQKGRPELVLEADDWTLSTKDGSLSGLFECTVAVLDGKGLVLTPIFW